MRSLLVVIDGRYRYSGIRILQRVGSKESDRRPCRATVKFTCERHLLRSEHLPGPSDSVSVEQDSGLYLKEKLDNRASAASACG